MPHKPFAVICPFLPGFLYGLKKLPPDVLELAKQALRDLYKSEIPANYKLRRSYANVYVVTFGPNNEYRMSMGIRDNIAWLYRVGTHKELDESPS